MSGLEQSDREAESHAIAPRVTLADIEAEIVARYDLNAGSTIANVSTVEVNPALDVLSLCIVVLKNGYTIVGKSAPASPLNFNAAFGRKLAYDDCLRQIWPLMGYALRVKLAEDADWERAANKPVTGG